MFELGVEWRTQYCHIPCLSRPVVRCLWVVMQSTANTMWFNRSCRCRYDRILSSLLDHNMTIKPEEKWRQSCRKRLDLWKLGGLHVFVGCAAPFSSSPKIVARQKIFRRQLEIPESNGRHSPYFSPVMTPECSTKHFNVTSSWLNCWSTQCHRAKYCRTIRRINPGIRICRTNEWNRITTGEAAAPTRWSSDTRILCVFGLFFCWHAAVKTFFLRSRTDRWESDSRKHQGSNAPIVTLWGTRIEFWESYIRCRTTKALRIVIDTNY